MRLRPGLVTSTLALITLAACTGPAAPDPAPPAPTSAAPTSAAPTSADPATAAPTATAPAPVDLTAFRSDSVQCQFDAPDARIPGVGCQLVVDYTYDIPDAWLEFGIACADVSLGYEEQLGKLGCASDVSYEAAASSDALPAGTVVAHGGITCTLLPAGVSCVNAAGGVVSITPEAYMAATD